MEDIKAALVGIFAFCLFIIVIVICCFIVGLATPELLRGAKDGSIQGYIMNGAFNSLVLGIGLLLFIMVIDLGHELRKK